jgi:2-oxoglutarate/2-oxoacid ferredoxin oxidoreductase subunit alpha
LEHRIGGLEKEDITGMVSQDPMNHQKMSEIRAKKIENIENDIPLSTVQGKQEGDLLILGWGGTYGAIQEAFDKLTGEGINISYCHLTHLNPLPKNLGEILNRFKRILVPELNLGQLKTILQGKFIRPILGLNKIQGLPLKEFEVEEKVKQLLQEMEI